MKNFTYIPHTYQQLVEIMEMAGNNMASCAIERMMVIVEEETGAVILFSIDDNFYLNDV